MRKLIETTAEQKLEKDKIRRKRTIF